MKQPLKVLSTSLGLMLAGHMLLVPAGAAETTLPGSAAAAAPKLVEWSSEEVKAYFDANVDWSLAVLPLTAEPVEPTSTPSPESSPGGTNGSGSPIIVNHGGGFGWDDLLLYHLIFNSGSPYSSSRWVNDHRTYDYRTNKPYATKSYSNTSFSNRSTTKTPTTSSGTGTFTTNKSSSSTTTGSNSVSSSNSSSSSSSKSTSTSSGSIGGKSSGFSSSGGSTSSSGG